MNRTKFLYCLGSLICGSLICVFFTDRSADAQLKPPQQEAESGWLDHWRLSTFSFGMAKTDEKGRSFFQVVGTGFLIATDDQTAYIATAKHVFDDPAKKWKPKELKLRFAWEEKDSVYDNLGTTIRLVDAADKSLWMSSDDGADVAALPVKVQELPRKSATQIHAISTTDIASKKDIFEGANVVVLGYPGVVGNSYLVRAIVRSGIVAWLNPEDPYGKPFMIDANIYPGNSGGPVIRIPTGQDKSGSFNIGGKVSLLGIVSQAPGVNQELILTVPGNPLPLKLNQTIPLAGTGFVEPAAKLLSLVDKLREKRDGGN